MKAMLISFRGALIKIATSGILRKYSPFYRQMKYAKNFARLFLCGI